VKRLILIDKYNVIRKKWENPEKWNDPEEKTSFLGLSPTKE